MQVPPEKRCLWIMDYAQLTLFRSHKQIVYREQNAIGQHEHFNDSVLSKYYTKSFISFFRKRKSEVEAPWKFEKVIYLAISLFKRYYLVNSFMSEQPTQSFICAINLAMKINEYNDDHMLKIAKKWRQKEVFEPRRGHLHFGDPNYTETQIRFLNGIRFQTGLSKLIQPIESLYSCLAALDQRKHVIESIRRLLEKIYFDDDLMFLYEGPQLALAIVVLVLKEHSISQQLLPTQITELIQKNSDRLCTIAERIEAVQIFNMSEGVIVKQFRSLREKTKKPVFRKPEAKRKDSPHFTARHDP